MIDFDDIKMHGAMIKKNISKIFGLYVKWLKVGSCDWNWRYCFDQNSKENSHPVGCLWISVEVSHVRVC